MEKTMACWQLNQLRLVHDAVGETQTFRVVLGESNRLGFQFCSFGLKSPVPVVAPRVAWYSNYPDAWINRYNERHYIRRDPTVAHAITSDEPIVWSEAVFRECPDIYEGARSFGLVYGVAQPMRDVNGLVSLLTLARTDPALSGDELAQKIDRIQWLSHLCHEGMRKAWKHIFTNGIEGSLSQRELDVLRWSCEGKTSAEIAQILGIVEATVNHHTRTACNKLGASNRTAAAVRAALIGLLW